MDGVRRHRRRLPGDSVFFVVAGPPRAPRRTGGPLRSCRHVMGLPHLPQHDADKVRRGNRELHATARVLHEATSLGIACGIENSAGSFLWRTPALRRLLALSSARPTVVDMCAFGAPWRKRTRLVMWNAEPPAPPRCTRRHGACSFSGKHHVILEGRDASGMLWTQRAQEYPTGLAAAIATSLAKGNDAARLQHLCSLGI